MKKFLLSIFAVLFAFAGVQAETATLSFADKAQRTSFSTTKQVWEQNGITLTNNKASSTNNVADYADPARFYKSSEIIVECGLGNITGIEFTCSTNSYATALMNSISGSTASGSVVTVTLDGTSNSYTISSLSGGQVRMNSLTVTYVATGAGEVAKPVTPSITADNAAAGKFVGSTMVEISCTTDDVAIYYTTNGDEPTDQSEVYNAPFEISTTTTVKAIAVNEAGESNIATAEFTRVAADPVLVYDATSFDDKITVSVTSDNDVYYTLDNTKPNAESTLYEGALTLKATATLKVIAIDAEGYESAVVEQKFTKNESASGASETVLVTDASTLAVGDQIVIVASDYNYALSTTQNSNNRGQAPVTKDGNNITYGADVQIITLEEGSVDGTFAFNVGTGYLYAASSSGNQLKTKATLDENGSWAISVTDGKTSITAPSSSNRNVMQYNQSSSLFSCYASASQKALSVYKINKASIEAYTLSVSAAGWATLCLNYDAEIPAGATCYAVSAVDGEYATLAEVEGVIPANTGVIVEANQGNYTFNVATEEGSDVASELIGTTVNTYITKEAYVLGIVGGVVGLYKAEMAGGVWLNNANKAYLPASVANGAASYSFRFGEGTTGVEKVEIRNEKSEIYDLTGRRVENPSNGIYIINGVKTLVK